MSQTIAALDVPVLHQGYLQFFEAVAPKASALYLFDRGLLQATEKLHAEIRAVEPAVMKGLIESLGMFETVAVLTKKNLSTVASSAATVFTADEQISRTLVEKHFPQATIETEPIFLRWDSKSVYSQEPVNYSATSTDPFDREMMELAAAEGAKTSDWWRAVGAVLVKDRHKVLVEHNHHVPSDHTPYANGDPRDVIEAGKDSHLATAMHAEQTIIVEAARRGIALEGASLYCSVFPCTVCAKLVAYSGIKQVYFGSGHASLDGETILTANNVEIILAK